MRMLVLGRASSRPPIRLARREPAPQHPPARPPARASVCVPARPPPTHRREQHRETSPPGPSRPARLGRVACSLPASAAPPRRPPAHSRAFREPSRHRPGLGHRQPAPGLAWLAMCCAPCAPPTPSKHCQQPRPSHPPAMRTGEARCCIRASPTCPPAHTRPKHPPPSTSGPGSCPLAGPPSPVAASGPSFPPMRTAGACGMRAARRRTCAACPRERSAPPWSAAQAGPPPSLALAALRSRARGEGARLLASRCLGHGVAPRPRARSHAPRDARDMTPALASRCAGSRRCAALHTVPPSPRGISAASLAAHTRRTLRRNTCALGPPSRPHVCLSRGSARTPRCAPLITPPAVLPRPVASRPDHPSGPVSVRPNHPNHPAGPSHPDRAKQTVSCGTSEPARSAQLAPHGPLLQARPAGPAHRPDPAQGRHALAASAWRRLATAGACCRDRRARASDGVLRPSGYAASSPAMACATLAARAARPHPGSSPSQPVCP